MIRRVNKPTTIILFGAMGDLAWRKLLPALFDLYSRGFLPEEVRILGASREPVDTAEFKKHVRKKVPGVSRAFLDLLSYTQIDLLNEGSYTQLRDVIEQEEQKHFKKRGNRLFHCAIPPKLYASVFEYLEQSGLAEEEGGSWTRILVEKPFGFDLKTARALNAQAHSSFKEEQLYRVDHYLAKEAVESLMAFRFTNVLFAHVWDKSHISSVHIRMYETMGVENRGAFYDSVGALRDVGQNHLLQLVALLAMEQPRSLTARDVSMARADILKHLKINTKGGVEQYALRAQYKGYRDIPGVDPHSQRETYFALHAHIDKPEWEGVPFLIEGGKALAEDRIDITIVFRRHTSCLCRPDSPAHEHANTLTFTLKPENKIEISFWIKEPGFEYQVEEHTLSFTHNTTKVKNAGDAYAEILYDALIGERMVFPSAEEIEYAWQFVDSILSVWRNNKDTPLVMYERGSIPYINE